MKTFIGLIFVCLLVSGCSSTHNPPVEANDPRFAPIIPEYPREQIVTDGGLFRPTLVNNLYSDVTARRVGDIITVSLRETTNASKLANTISINNTSMEVAPSISGQFTAGDALALGVESGKNFFGDARTNQSNTLFGNISVTVVDVMPNNHLVIRGEKWMTINGSDEYIRLTGIIRSEDISPMNVIDSTKVANARIQYSGKGDFNRLQERGWLFKFFGSEWWPF